VSGVGDGAEEVVDRADEPFEEAGELDALGRGEGAEDVGHELRPPFGDLGVAGGSGCRDGDADDPAVVVARVPGGEPGVHEPLHRTGGGRRIDAEGLGQLAHTPRVALGERVERVHLSLVERIVACAEEVVAEVAHGGASPELDPGEADADGELALFGRAEIDRLDV
jgi:hypothetical protein